MGVEGQSNTRFPRLRVLIDGQVATGVIDVRVMSTNYYSADWFHISLTYAGDHTPSLSFWASVDDCEVDIQCRIQSTDEYYSLIEGMVDSVVVDPVYRVVRVEGRDRSACLISTCTPMAFANLSASEIVSLIALRGGLVPNVYPTFDLAGRFYGQGHDSILIGQYARNTTDWDLAVQLARREGYDLFVRGKDLYFQPPRTNSPPPFNVTPRNVSELRMERSLGLRSDIEMSVRSWNSQLRKSFGTDIPTMADPLSQSLSMALGGSGARSMVMSPNLRPDDISKMQRLMLQDLAQHRRTIEIEMPGELDMTPRSQIVLAGTESEFDQSYDIESVDRIFGPVSGYIQRIRARQSNLAADLMPILL